MNQNLFSQILPEVDFNISSSGITVLSSRLTTPRFIPYDQSGRCKECKSTEVEIDFIVTKEGITIYCTRIGSGTRFVPFDTVYDLPTHCFFKIKNKGRVFNVPHGVQQQIIHQNPKRGKRKLDELPPTTAPTNNLSSPPPANLPSQISPTPLVPPIDCPNCISNTSRPDTPPDNVEFENELQEFYDSLMASTTGLTSSPKKLEESEEKKDDTNVPI
uniref:Uncharacterized protein n=1 Tax=Meloidogyne enterolobii TaxID=390850 RepID=A0A6V7XRL8_MELEN|nr:unnamed protein product [Meloidogyne enterolobii]